MNRAENIVLQAQFNPKIKSYVKFQIGVILLVTFIGIPILILWILGLGNYVGNRYYKNLKCQLTTRHLEFKKGVFIKVEKTIPLENIQDLTFIQNPILNYLGLKILKIETAGNSNPHGTDMKLMGIVNPEQFKEQVLTQREILQNQSMVSPANENRGNTADESVILLREIRDLLKSNTKG